MRAKARSILLLLLLVAPPARAQDAIVGSVTHVRDGDTIEVEGIAIRLQGIAAPERGDPLGRRATAAMKALVAGRRILCRPDGSRSWDRIVARCFLAGRDIGEIMVRLGLARDCPRYSGGRYAAAERAADRPIAEVYPLPSYCLPRQTASGPR